MKLRKLISDILDLSSFPLAVHPQNGLHHFSGLGGAKVLAEIVFVQDTRDGRAAIQSPQSEAACLVRTLA